MKKRNKSLVLAVTGGFLALGALGLTRNVSIGWTSDAMAATDDSSVKVRCAQSAVSATVADPTFDVAYTTSASAAPTVSSTMTLNGTNVAGDPSTSVPTTTLIGATGALVIDNASPYGKVTGFHCQGVGKVDHMAYGVNGSGALKVAYRSQTGADGSVATNFFATGQADTATAGAPRYIASLNPTAILPEITDGGIYDNDGMVNAEVVDGGNGTGGAFNLQVSIPAESLTSSGVEEVITHSYIVH